LGNDYTSKTGIEVSEEDSLTSTAVWSAVTQLSQSIASLPLHLYKRLKPKGKEKYTAHRLYNLMHLEPNPEMTALAFREAQAGQVLITGTSYAEIAKDKLDRIVALWPLISGRMELLRMDNGELVYRYQLPDGTHKVFAREKILRVNGFSHSGLLGYQPIAKNREAIGVALALQEYFARFFGDGAKPPAALEHPGRLSGEAQDRLRKNWNTLYQGLSNSQRVAILEEGMTLKTFGVSPEQAQAIDARKFQIDEVCRVFNMPPHMLKSLDRATYSNIEEQGLEFVIYTLRPWLVRHEQAYATQLLNEKERKKYFFEHAVSGLLRGDIEKRYGAYVQAISNGLMNADEVRELENMNPQADGQGEKYYVPLNWIPKEDAGEMEVPAREPPKEIVDIDKEEKSIKEYWENIKPPEKREKLKIDHKMIHGLVRIEVSHQKSIRAVAQQVVSKECNAVKRAVKKYKKKKFLDWVDTFYADHEKYIREKYMPIMGTFFESIHQEASNVLGVSPNMTPDLEAFAGNFVARMAFTHCQSSMGQIKKIYKETPTEKRDYFDDLLNEGIGERADDWFLTRADKIALDESARATNAMSRETWATNGVRKLKWVAIGKSCDFCKGMDGRVVSIKRNFLDAGNVIYSGPNDTDFDIYDPVKGENVFSLNPRPKARDEKWQALKVYGNKAHPPIHKN
jgi:HK97 family phage portal protein